jgi:Glycosyltransferase family 92
MSGGPWERFVEYAREVRARPRFDESEYHWKFEVAEQARSLIAAPPDEPGPLLERLEAVFPPQITFRDHRLDLPEPRNLNWMRRWGRFDAPALAEALSAFGAGDSDPVARFAAFERSALGAPAETRSWSGGILAMGSWLNFAIAPDVLPIMRMAAFQRLEELLAYPAAPRAPVADAYAHHLGFAGQVKDRLHEAGIEVRDMVDVQSMIFSAALEHGFWAEEHAAGSDKRPVARERGRKRPYLSVGAIYRDEARYLPEWLEFHRLVGVERFFLYNNRSTDDHLEVLEPYVDDGTVVVHDWPQYPGQVDAYRHCLRRHGADSRWLAFLDLDEFLFSPTGMPVAELLVDYERYPGVAVNWVMFGTGGHRTRPPGLVIETHQRRAAKPWPFVKQIVDPARVERCLTVHAFRYTSLCAVDENQVPLAPSRGRTKLTSVARLRINHYYLKSEAEGRAKLAAPKPDGGGARPPDFDALDQELNEQTDNEIARYAPAVREALARRQSRAYT